ncbi:MAG TPA: hypothetical protein VHX62_00635 [Solirubrobacteraceae bacterium]|jgi:hypothetical protein|nr:hypothetical protein [Solirubrobacteraceae bacterium]
MQIDLNTSVSCVDGPFGELASVVIDPGSRRVTHVVLQPHHHVDGARLMPVRSARSGEGPGAISLTCTVATIGESESIQQSAYVRRGELIDPGPGWDVGLQETYGMSVPSSVGPEILGAGVAMQYDEHVGVMYHRIPKGTVEIRGASPVTSSECDHLGHVVGMVIDETEQITRLMFEHGHLWGKRIVDVPGVAIGRLQTDEVVLTLSSDEIGKLGS